MTPGDIPAQIGGLQLADDGVVLGIEGLTVAYPSGNNWLDAVREFNLEINAGETVGLVGESGSGKSTVALAVMGYLPNGRIQSGRIIFQNQDLLTLPPGEMRRIWGKAIGLVPQDPLSALNPAIRVGEQLAEGLRLHRRMGKSESAARAVKLLEMVHVPDPPRVAASFPHQLSGGMQQRVMIAMAFSLEPALLILDEPTTNLDVTTQAAVLDLLQELIAQRNTAVLYVTHNLGVVARFCDRVAVLYAGELLETAPVAELYRRSLHPYTQGLLGSVPQLGQNKAGAQLKAIPGQIPSLGQRPEGCVFAPRCALATEICHQKRPLLEVAVPGHQTRCHLWQNLAESVGPTGSSPVDSSPQPAFMDRPATPLLNLDQVQVTFRGRGRRRTVRAVNGLSLEAMPGETVGIVGESGSGKTTLARAIIGLTPRTGGNIELQQVKLPPTLAKRSKETLRQLQYVFQNPEEALNPAMTVGETLERPFINLQNASRKVAQNAAIKLLQAVRLSPDYAQRYPGQLSGGEKQRVAIARAFATNPNVLNADEAVSALDVSVQASILQLLHELQREQQNTLLFISHDLAVVGYLADQIAVMYGGQLMEIAAAADLFSAPHHPYTAVLLSAVPHLDPEVPYEPVRLVEEISESGSHTTGCPFHSRCPRTLGAVCRTKTPPWRVLPGGKRIFCHIEVEDL